MSVDLRFGKKNRIRKITKKLTELIKTQSKVVVSQGRNSPKVCAAESGKLSVKTTKRMIAALDMGNTGLCTSSKPNG